MRVEHIWFWQTLMNRGKHQCYFIGKYCIYLSISILLNIIYSFWLEWTFHMVSPMFTLRNWCSVVVSLIFLVYNLGFSCWFPLVSTSFHPRESRKPERRTFLCGGNHMNFRASRVEAWRTWMEPGVYKCSLCCFLTKSYFFTQFT